MRKGKKEVKKSVIAIIALMILVIASLCGCGTDASDYEDDYEEESYESYAEYDESDDYEEDEDYDDSEESDDFEEDDSSDSSTSRRDFTSEDDFPTGTCGKLEGKTVIMSIAANDATTSWDFDNSKDVEALTDMSRKVFIGLEWIKEQGQKYGKNIEFIYNWDDDDELFYTADLSADYSNGMSNLQDQKSFIDEKLSSYADKLLTKYNADNILFMIYFNEPQNTDFVCFATPFQGTERGMDLPYETVCIDNYVYGSEQGPATYAHEILHLFGAPDLYSADEDGSNRGMTQEFVDYCEKNHINEIMFSTYDPYKNTIPLDKVSNELTDLTAYFVGWIDSNEECEEFGIVL